MKKQLKAVAGCQLKTWWTSPFKCVGSTQPQRRYVSFEWLDAVINLSALIIPHWPFLYERKAVRELPPIKYAKRLGNQVLSSMRILETGYQWFGKNIRLVCPRDDTGTEEELRSYLEVVRVCSWFASQMLLCSKAHSAYCCSLCSNMQGQYRGPTTLFKCHSERISQREQTRSLSDITDHGCPLMTKVCRTE